MTITINKEYPRLWCFTDTTNSYISSLAGLEISLDEAQALHDLSVPVVIIRDGPSLEKKIMWQPRLKPIALASGSARFYAGTLELIEDMLMEHFNNREKEE